MTEQSDGNDRPDDLFSRWATDNAEVVPPSAPRTHDELWSTVSEPEDVPAEPPVRSHGVGWERDGDVFSSQPVERDGDVLDEDVDEPPPAVSFGTGGEPVDSSLWRDLAPPEPGSGSSPDWSVLRDDLSSEQDASSGSALGDVWPGTTSAPQGPAPSDGRDPADDPNGYEAAVQHIEPTARQRTTVPLVVAGALLLPGEHVEWVLTGTMLGAPAVLVVTGARVLVINDRRWQPVVDVYRLDHRLTVRGRSDRGVAAISLADEDHLSMVDGIVDVPAAMAVADRIRDAAASS